jgi:hypothetical protein
MPVVLPREELPMWLGERDATADQVLGTLRPFPTR